MLSVLEEREGDLVVRKVEDILAVEYFTSFHAKLSIEGKSAAIQNHVFPHCVGRQRSVTAARMCHERGPKHGNIFVTAVIKSANDDTAKVKATSVWPVSGSIVSLSRH